VGTQVVGDARKTDGRLRLGSLEGRVETAAERRAQVEIEPSRFAGRSIITYKTVQGENLYALQLQPTIEAVSRPKDILVLVDTSASQANGPLKTAREITQGLAKTLGPDDRISVWTANLQPKNLTGGFTTGSKVDPALTVLKELYPTGATSLKACLSAAMESFDGGDGRQRTIIFMGDGLSVADPLDAETRASLSAEMVKREISVVPIPLGVRMDPINIHGLATSTGGRTLRVEGGESIEQMVAKIQQTLKAPVLYPEVANFSKEMGEVLPTRLPPVRSDVPTLLVGKLAEGAEAKQIGYEILGRVAGRPTKVSQNFDLPKAEDQNFFLTQVVGQWRDKKDRPAILQGDRALVMAFEQNRLALEDALARGEFALRSGRPDAAAKLFRQAAQLDPASNEAKAGLKFSEQMVLGKLKPEEMAVKNGIPGVAVVQAGGTQPPAGNLPAPAAQPPAGGDMAGADAIREVQARRAAAEQLIQKRVNEGIREAQRQLRESPTAALEDLKRLKDEVENNIDIGLDNRNALVGRLVREIQRTEKDGREIERQQKEYVDATAKLQAMADEERRVTVQNERIRERMRFYHDLMTQAREDEAQRVAQTIRRDLTNQGLEIPKAVTAAYYEGGRAYHLRELRDLRRQREENFLATLLEVERSHIPFPDEPPIVWAGENSPLFHRKAFDRTYRFRNWKELSDYRRANYNDPGYEPPVPESARKIREILTSQVSIKEFDLPSAKVVKDVIQSVLSDRFGVDVIVNYKAFEADGNDKVEDQDVGDRKIRAFKGKLSNWLRVVTEDHIKGGTGATYLIRDDHVEITTQQAALNEKVIRIYPVADLIFPIQNAVNPAQVQQASTLFGFGGSYGLAGQSIAASGLNAIGGNLGALGALGGALGGAGGLGALGGGLGALGGGLGVLGGGGGLGALGAGGLGGGLGAIGGGGAMPGGQLGGNLGAGAVGNFGMVGSAGNIGNQGALGTAGQFGNLGGQFGLQGGPDWNSLLYTIRYMVGTSKDWTYQAPPPGAGVADPTSNFYGQGSPDGVTFGENGGTFGPYPPAFALIVRNTSRTHTGRFTPPFTFGASANPNPNMVAAPGNNKAIARNDQQNNQPAAAGDKALVNAKDKLGFDPRKVWQEALEQGVTNQGLIIATADFLGSNGHWEHAAEFLKANLRQGLVVKPWVYQSLAIALRESGASPEEIERAEVASADLEPLDSKGFERAAKGMAQSKNYDRAVAFARQASFLDPANSQPLLDTLAYAELGNKPEMMNWAASRLLSQDWADNNEKIHEKTRGQLDSMARRVEPRDPEAARLLKDTLNTQLRRDLVVHLAYQGDADVDLRMKEPTGSVCSILQKQTIGGGTHLGNDILSRGHESYIASEAFSGEYEIRVEKVWGKPMGDKAQLRIIRHQGTPQQYEEVMQLDLSKEVKPIKLKLENGRRREFAYVAPPAQIKKTINRSELANNVQNKLRNIANPAVVGSTGPKVVMVTPGSEVASMNPPAPAVKQPETQVLYQTRVNSFMKNALDMTTDVVLSADGKGQRTRLNLIDRGKPLDAPVVNSSVIPGDN